MTEGSDSIAHRIHHEFSGWLCRHLPQNAGEIIGAYRVVADGRGGYALEDFGDPYDLASAAGVPVSDAERALEAYRRIGQFYGHP